MSKTNYQKIVEFHVGADGRVPDEPTIPQEEILTIRRTLIREEYEEVMAAFADIERANGREAKPALIELSHELADLLYVVYGTFAACGVDADEVFGEVHAANMRKLGGPRRADGKLLKPPDWQPADVAGVITNMAKNGNMEK